MDWKQGIHSFLSKLFLPRTISLRSHTFIVVRKNFADLDDYFARYQVSMYLVSTCSCVTLHLPPPAPPCRRIVPWPPVSISGGPTRSRWACYEAGVRSLSRTLPCERSTFVQSCLLFTGAVILWKEAIAEESARVADTTTKTTSSLQPLTSPPRWLGRLSLAGLKGMHQLVFI